MDEGKWEAKRRRPHSKVTGEELSLQESSGQRAGKGRGESTRKNDGIMQKWGKEGGAGGGYPQKGPAYVSGPPKGTQQKAETRWILFKPLSLKRSPLTFRLIHL